MTTTLVLGHSSDGYLESSSTTYATALAGANLIAPGSTLPLMFVGQSLGSGVRYVWQSFVRVDWVGSTTATPVAAYVRLTNNAAAGTNVTRDLELREYNWGTSLTTGNWRTPAQLAALTLRGRVAGAQQAGSLVVRAGLDLDQVESTATRRYVVCSSRNRNQQAPSGTEWNNLRQSITGNTAAQRVALLVTATTRHVMDLTLAAQVQLSDGTHVYLEQLNPGPEMGQYRVWHADSAGNATMVAAINAAADRRGAQSHTLTRDADDNLYVINQATGNHRINARALIKGAGYTWSLGTQRTGVLPVYDAPVNNVSAAWHPQGGAAGTLVVVAAHRPGPNTGTQMPYALLSCDHLLTGAGTLLRGSGDAEGRLIAGSAPDGFNNYANETGSLLEVVAAGPGSARGWVMSTAQHQVLGTAARQSLARYVLNAAGDGFSSMARTTDSVSGFSVKDADAKSRVLPISESQFVTVNASSTSSAGLTVKHRQNTGTSSEFVVLADVRLAAEGIASMPAAGTLATSPAWDAVYDPAGHRVWVYYTDASAPLRIMRTHVNLATGQAGRDEVEVTDLSGMWAGYTLRSIRVHRGSMVGQQVRLGIGLQTGASHTLIHADDWLNLPPEQPLLSPVANFDATGAVTLRWQFRDPNPGDAQSAYRIEIWDDESDTLALDTGKVASGAEEHVVAGGTLPNDAAYRWRARTWDALDVEGPWSEHGFFATSASGNTTIVFPAADNPAGLATGDVVVQWTVSGATQDHYRVRAVRTADEVVHSDTGWVPGTATTYLVTGLASEVEYRLEVTARASGVPSSTGTRLVTPDYTSPMEPVVTAVAVPGEAHIRIEVANPTPGEIVSGPDGTFEDGTTTGWQVVPGGAGTFVADDGTAWVGDYSGLLTPVGSPATVGVRPEEGVRAQVTGNHRYTLSSRLWRSASGSVRLAVDWYDDDGVLISSSHADVTADTEWELHEATFSAPPGAVRAGYGPTLLTPGTATLNLDALVLRTATDVPQPGEVAILRTTIDRADEEVPLDRYEQIAVIGPDSSHRDYLAASGRTYRYIARALATGATADSAPAQARVDYLGVWIHDPRNPEGTIRHYLHGRAQRSDTQQIAQEQRHYAGRHLPVTHFGEHAEEEWQITIDVPEGPTREETTRSLRAWHRLRLPVVVRDNRSRVWISTLSGFGVSDEVWGDQVSMTATRVDADTPGGEG
ncbi:hypothetical protein GCM10027160_23500 [Streptomyces calidiresistens]|uniref:Fibronectin type-III domain-containing protein n=1 Tax=Streptomyces calidiresistens TaxID=1485586 RepID=A0A7W3T2S9_9ACTN|nr:hypothetical protein [Streptomyces calidiresistens]MBB0229894.1 hypothetical protein [Streptomyces calidiresistens]